MIGLIFLCLLIALGLWATERVSTVCRDQQWREWIESKNCVGPAPDGKRISEE